MSGDSFETGWNAVPDSDCNATRGREASARLQGAFESLRLAPSDANVPAGAWMACAVDGALPDDMIDDFCHRVRLLTEDVPSNTLRARRVDARAFADWAWTHKLCVLSATRKTMVRSIVDFISAEAEGKAPRTVRRRISTMNQLLSALGHANVDPLERRLLVSRAAQATRKRVGRRGSVKSRLLAADVERMLRAVEQSDTPKRMKLRDRAIILVFQDILARRSEIEDLLLSDYDPETATIFLPRSKTDQTGEGCFCALSAETCDALDAWIESATLRRHGPREQPIFKPMNRVGGLRGLKGMSGRDFGRVIQRWAKAAGLGFPVSCHSLRRGSAQQLLVDGASPEKVMAYGRWKNPDTMRDYVGIPPVTVGARDFGKN